MSTVTLDEMCKISGEKVLLDFCGAVRIIPEFLGVSAYRVAESTTTSLFKTSVSGRAVPLVHTGKGLKDIGLGAEDFNLWSSRLLDWINRNHVHTNVNILGTTTRVMVPREGIVLGGDSGHIVGVRVAGYMILRHVKLNYLCILPAHSNIIRYQGVEIENRIGVSLEDFLFEYVKARHSTDITLNVTNLVERTAVDEAVVRANILCKDGREIVVRSDIFGKVVCYTDRSIENLQHTKESLVGERKVHWS